MARKDGALKDLHGDELSPAETIRPRFGRGRFDYFLARAFLAFFAFFAFLAITVLVLLP